MLKVYKKFSNLTYWNLDSEPSEDDMIVQALKWTNIAHSVLFILFYFNNSTDLYIICYCLICCCNVLSTILL